MYNQIVKANCKFPLQYVTKAGPRPGGRGAREFCQPRSFGTNRERDQSRAAPRPADELRLARGMSMPRVARSADPWAACLG
jgi:hypothetical protein